MKYITVCLTALAIGIFAITGYGPQAVAAELWKTLPAPLPTPGAKATGYANVNGAEIYFTIHGSGAPLILLHGGLGNTDYWGGQIARFQFIDPQRLTSRVFQHWDYGSIVRNIMLLLTTVPFVTGCVANCQKVNTP